MDGDGVRDLCLAIKERRRRYGIDCRIVVNALSGKDGTMLWHWEALVPDPIDDPRIKSVEPWQPGPDGLPTLMLSCSGMLSASSVDQTNVTFVLEAGSGRTLHEITGVADPLLGDLNGDGIADLSWFDRGGRGIYGTLYAVNRRSCGGDWGWEDGSRRATLAATEWTICSESSTRTPWPP